MNKIFIYTTSDCNHKCKHCYLGYKGKFDPDILVGVVKALSEKYDVIINGAEPLVNIDYLKAYEAAGQDFIFSNGIILADEKESIVFDEMHKRGIKRVRLSHHFSSINELGAVREVIIEKAISNLQRNNFIVELNTTITKINLNDIEKICEYCVLHDIHRIKFFALMDVGKATDLDRSLFLSAMQLESFYMRIMSLRRKYPIEVLKIRVDGNIGRFSNKFECVYGLDGIAIVPDGRIFGCPFAVGNRKPIGYLSENYEIVIEENCINEETGCFLQKK